MNKHVNKSKEAKKAALSLEQQVQIDKQRRYTQCAKELMEAEKSILTKYNCARTYSMTLSPHLEPQIQIKTHIVPK